ncbi:acetylajmalan esterase-like [Typha latifolia]|uniref:acetylajmalan esterase-like n=1 Tax=Typha latifolia TaxID=4733 RepID=UPI003C3095FD
MATEANKSSECSPRQILPETRAVLTMGSSARHALGWWRRLGRRKITGIEETFETPVGVRWKLTQDCSIEAIYSFGDSIADTGNLLKEGVSNGSFSGIANLPYGKTTFGQATGRCSNGLLMIDYITRDLDLPLLNPYLDKQANFDNGVNFAVAGATALDQSFFAQGETLPPFTNSSLGVQLGWFKDYLKTICSSQEDCAAKINKALFFVGEIGGNDYNYAFFAQQTIEEVQQMIPVVVQQIINVSRELLDMGATRLVIPGNFPIGCMPGYLALVNSSNPKDYDENNCLISLNAFAVDHNAKLFDAIEDLQASYPNAVILYSDYYNALRFLLNNAYNLGTI